MLRERSDIDNLSFRCELTVKGISASLPSLYSDRAKTESHPSIGLMCMLVDESRRRDLDQEVSKIFILKSLGFFIAENFPILVGIIMYGEHYFIMFMRAGEVGMARYQNGIIYFSRCGMQEERSLAEEE